MLAAVAVAVAAAAVAAAVAAAAVALTSVAVSDDVDGPAAIEQLGLVRDVVGRRAVNCWLLKGIN